VYFIIYKVDSLFSILIPNFFFKASNAKEQFSEISLDKKKVSNKVIKKSFVDKSFLNKNLLLLALHLQKVSNLLATLNNSNQASANKLDSIAFNLDLVPNYYVNYSSTVFLFTKRGYNNYYNYKFNLTELDSSYKLQNKDLSYLNTYTSKIDLLTLYNSNFKLQKFISSNISKNLNMSKQNRWMWKSSILDDKSFVNLSTVTHLKKTLFNSELSTSAANKNI
jgi:hypothetical protein